MSDVLEYLFFTRPMANRFAEVLAAKALPYEEDIEPVQGAIVLKIAEGVDDALWDELDDIYDELSEQDQAALESGEEDETAKSTAGIYVQLAGGKQTIAQIDPDVMNRMLSVITVDELNTFVDVIARSVETPDDSAICQR